MKNKILVTGASGFIGRQALIPLVEKGFEVHAVCRHPLKEIAGVTWHSTNLLDVQHTNECLREIKPSHLLHTAWVTEHGKFWQAPENKYWLESSKNLFQAFVAAGGTRIIGIGSCAEYEWRRKDNSPWKETDPCHPHTPYGKAKLALLEWLAAYAEKHAISYAWARLFLLFGPYENPARIIPYLINSALHGKPAHCSSGTQIRDFLDSETCGNLLAEIAASDLTGPVNLASGQAHSLKEIAAKIYDIAQKPNDCEFDPKLDRPDDPPYMVADIDTLRKVTKISDKYDISRALKTAIEWMARIKKKLIAS